MANPVQFLLQDLFETDLRAATVVTLYLMQSVNLQLRLKLWRELQQARVVSMALAWVIGSRSRSSESAGV